MKLIEIAKRLQREFPDSTVCFITKSWSAKDSEPYTNVELWHEGSQTHYEGSDLDHCIAKLHEEISRSSISSDLVEIDT